MAGMIVVAGAGTTLARDAAAEVTMVSAQGWELFSDGRLGGFANYTRGDAFPLSLVDAGGSVIQAPFGGGIGTNVDSNSIADPANPTEQRKLESMRVRSGFLSNIFGFGVRTALTPWTKVSGYIQFWANIESNGERKYVTMPVDVRQGFVRVDGLWGSVTVGRMLTLFSRGAADIDFLYGHGYGVGFPAAGVGSGTAAGHVGTGVLGPGFASGVIYYSPVLAGLQINVGLFDPVALQGAWDRTKLLRPESEITYDRALGARARLHLFVNGGYQKVYRINEPDSTSSAAYGVGYGLRAEVGGFHLGLAGHWGQGLGLTYALETTEAAYDSSTLHRLRKSDGYYAQAQYALRRFDFNAGIGISRVKPLGEETQIINGVPTVVPADGAPSGPSMTRQSLIKYQLGISAAVVYHVSPALHLDVDYFRANFRWQLGEKEDVNFVSAGMTLTW